MSTNLVLPWKSAVLLEIWANEKAEYP